MEKFSASFILILFAVISGNIIAQKVNAASCDYLDRIGGGCPDVNKCVETCRPCYVGVGVVQASCVAPEGPIIFWRCRCSFSQGAPCPPPGRACPGPGLLSSEHLLAGNGI